MTDAHVALGHIPPDRFLAGRMPIDRDRSIAALADLAGARDWETVAQGVLAIVRSNMMRALRSVSVARGQDPRRFTLVSFGGAGSLHVFHLRRGLELAGLVVPVAPGALSAVGMLGGAPLLESERAIGLELSAFDPGHLEEIHDALVARHEGRVQRGTLDHDLILAMRYRGRSEILDVPADRSGGAGLDLLRLRGAFDRLHGERFGYQDSQEVVEVAAIKVRSRGRSRPLRLPPLEPAAGLTVRERAGVGRTRMFDEGWVEAEVYDRTRFAPGDRIEGPALVIDATATILVPGFGSLTVDPRGLLVGDGSSRRSRRG